MNDEMHFYAEKAYHSEKSMISFDKDLILLRCCDRYGKSLNANSRIAACIKLSSDEIITSKIVFSSVTFFDPKLERNYLHSKFICYPYGDEKYMCTGVFSKATYDLFDHINGDEIVETLYSFCRFSDHMQADILSRLNGERFSTDSCTDTVGNLSDIVNIQKIINILMPTFTLEQQAAISSIMQTALHGRSDARIDALKKLRSFLLIRTGTKPEINKTYEEILKDIRSRYYFGKDSSLAGIIADLIADIKYCKGNLPNILLLGPPGTGKTSLMKLIANEAGMHFHQLDLGSINTKDDLLGDSSVFTGSDAGQLFNCFLSEHTSAFCLGLDELDSLNNNRNGKSGNTMDALSEFLSERVLRDNYEVIPIEAKHTLVIASSNSLSNIPESVLNRFIVVDVPAFSDAEKAEIAKEFVIPDLLRERGLDSSNIIFSDNVLLYIAQNYTADFGLRDMKACIRAILVHSLRAFDKGVKKICVTVRYADTILSKYSSVDKEILFFKRHIEFYSESKKREIERLTTLLRKLDLNPDERSKFETKRTCLIKCIPTEDIKTKAFDYDEFVSALESEFYGMDSTIEAVGKNLYSMYKSGNFRAAALGLEGPFGVGKTAIAHAIAEAVGLPMIEINCQSVDDPQILSGTPFSYASSRPGLIAEKACAVCSTKAVILFNELGLMGNVNGKSTQALLLDMLDGSGYFKDNFTDEILDFSQSLIIATWNDSDDNYIMPQIRDRFSTVHLSGYSDSQKKQIAVRHVIPKALKEADLSGVTFTEGSIDSIVSDYAAGAGVRNIEKAAEKIIAEVNLMKRNSEEEITVTSDMVRKILGQPNIARGNYPPFAYPGLVKGLAVTGNNEGMVFAVDSVLIDDGRSEVTITGLAEEDVRETVYKALTCIRSNSNYAKLLEGKSIHVDYGEGSVKKSGSSAGVATLISILSAALGVVPDQDSAMTGEISARGFIFPVGGLFAKLYAAQKSGCRRVFIPYGNINDPALSSRDLTVEVVPVRHVDEVIEKVILDDAIEITHVA